VLTQSFQLNKIFKISLVLGFLTSVAVVSCSNDNQSLMPNKFVEKAEQEKPNEPQKPLAGTPLKPKKKEELSLDAGKKNAALIEPTLGTIYDADFDKRCKKFEEFFTLYASKLLPSTKLTNVRCQEEYDFTTLEHVIPYNIKIELQKDSKNATFEFRVKGAEGASNHTVTTLSEQNKNQNYFGEQLENIGITLQQLVRIPQKKQSAYGLNYSEFLSRSKVKFEQIGINGIRALLDENSSSSDKLRMGLVSGLNLNNMISPEFLGCDTNECLNEKTFFYRFNGTRLYFLDSNNLSRAYLISDITKEFLGIN
jgi:hypothetical protein